LVDWISSCIFMYIRVEGILQLKQTLRWGYKVTNNKQTMRNHIKQLNELLSNLNGTDFQIEYFGVDVKPNNSELYSNSLDIVIGENYYPEEGKWIISKDGEFLGVFQTNEEVSNFINNLNKQLC